MDTSPTIGLDAAISQIEDLLIGAEEDDARLTREALAKLQAGATDAEDVFGRASTAHGQAVTYRIVLAILERCRGAA